MSVAITPCTYNGWNHCLRIANDVVECIATIDIGPRIIRFGFIGGENEFAEFPDEYGTTEDTIFHIYGGHRLWIAPETAGRTDYPDNRPVAWQEQNGAVILTAPTEETTGFQKQLCLRFDEREPRLSVQHTLINHHVDPLSLAVWGITVMAPGGIAYIPHEPFVAHENQVLPVRPLVLWGYTNMQDPRWRWGKDFIQLHHYSHATVPQKFGAQITEGIAAYFRKSHLFVKQFPFQADAAYPDFGCNAEFFSDHRMLEMESLGPLVTLQPNESISHTETWHLFQNIGAEETAIRQTLSSLVLPETKESRSV